MITENDIYNGYRIPKGATIVASHWGMNRDEKVYLKPDEFIPERWIENPDLPLAAFGFGRRSCPGEHLARNSLYIIIVRLLWAFDIEYVGNRPDPFHHIKGFTRGAMELDARFTVKQGRATTIREEWERTKQ